MKKSFFYRIMIVSIGALLAGIIACKNPASPEPVKPEQNVQTPSDNGLGGGGPAPTPNLVNPQTDQEKVEAAKAALKLRVNGKVSYWIRLPSRGAYDTSISWTSSPSGIINTNTQQNFGKVITQPAEDTPVTLTATITKGSATATKTFTVTVYGKNQELVDQAVQQIWQQPPAFVMGSGTSPETMTLQKTYGSGSDQVDFEWKAQPEGSVTFKDNLHNPSQVIGTVIQPEPPAEKKTVTLTATAKKGNATASRTFTVTVYPKNQTPSLTELLTQIMSTIPAETDKDIPLMRTVAYGYTLTWESDKPDVLKISKENYAEIITRDLVDRKATLTAKLSKNGSPSETAQKEKVVTVTAQTKFDNCELTGDLLTMRDYDGIVSAVYRVQIDADAKTITAAAEKVAYNGTLMTLDEAKRQELAEIESYIPAYRALLSLCDKPIVTLQDIKEAVIQMNPITTMSDEEAFEWITDKKESYDNFKDKNAEEKSQFLKSFLNKFKTEIYRDLSLPPDTPLEQALAQMKEQDTARITANVEKAKQPRAYTYRVENYNNRLYTEAPYVTGTPWYRQERGSYSYYDSDSQDIQSVWLSLRANGNGKYEVSIGIRKKDSERSDRFSAYGYDGSGDIKAKNRDDKQITVTVTEKGPRKAEVVCTGEISFTKELTFRGKEIPLNPLRD